MPTLYLIRGLPSSGKTTIATEMAKKQGGSIFRTSIDELRKSMFSGKTSNHIEIKLRLVQEKIINQLLKHDVSCIVDNNNLSVEELVKWNRIACSNNAKVKIQEVRTSVEECIRLDNTRTSPFGNHIIWKEALKNKMWMTYNGIVLCDLDGTIANIEERLKHIQGEYKDWESFYAEINTDTLRKEVLEDVLDTIDVMGYDLFLVTGRNEKYRNETVRWLKKHCPELLDEAKCIFMRGEKDFRPDTEVKQDIVSMIGSENIHLVYDDLPHILDMYRKHKIATIDCGEGGYKFKEEDGGFRF